MRELTPEIKLKIKNEAITRLQNGNALIVVNQMELRLYIDLLEEAWKKNQIVFSWEIN